MEIAIIGAGKVAERNYLPALLRHKGCFGHLLFAHGRTQRGDGQKVWGSFGTHTGRGLREAARCVAGVGA